MRGLQHNVIEINDTDNEKIEKILVFLKPGRQKIDVAGTRKDAEDILRKVKVRKSLPNVPEVVKNILPAAVGFAILAALLLLLL